jgi:hypothetical protein
VKWKLVGLAGLAGVAATGALIIRDERRRQDLTPEDVRARLHERHQAAGDLTQAPHDEGPAPTPGRFAHLKRRLRSRTRRSSGA